MAITDGTFTAQEITEAVTKNPELLKVVAPVLTANKYVVRDESAEKEYLTTYKNQEIGTYTSTIAKQVEDTVKSVAGIDRINGDEKWYDYNARALKTLKEKNDASDARIKEIEGKTDLSKHERDQLNQLKEISTSSEKKIKDLEEGYKKEIGKLSFQNTIILETAPIKSTFKAEIPPVAVDAMEKQVIAEMLAASRTSQNGKMVFVDDKDQVKLGAGGEFMTPKEYYTEKMKDFIDDGKKLTGPGGGPGPNDPLNTGEYKNKIQLGEALQAKGLVSGTHAFTAEWKKHKGDELPTR